MKRVKVFVIHSEKDDDVLKVLTFHYYQQFFINEKGEIVTLEIDFMNSKRADILGKDFGEGIKTKIDSSSEIVIILTHNCHSSTWVNQEIGYVLGKERECLPLIENQMIGKGLGFIHSNIDGQVFHYGRTEFHKFDEYFSNKYGKMLTPKEFDVIEELKR